MRIIPIGFAVLELGMISVTRAAAEELEQIPTSFALMRHMTGDWGELDEDGWAKNEDALRKGERIVSAYLSPDYHRFLIATEADRSATTILLPREC